MPLHNWTRVSAGTFHDFHCAWIVELRNALNGGVLPPPYYALAEQFAKDVGPDVLTLQAPNPAPYDSDSAPPGATAVLEAPPRVSLVMSGEARRYAAKQRTLVIRHKSGHRIVALVEIVSRGNKEDRTALESFVQKAVSALQHGYHLLILDPHPPGPHDPDGIHGAIWAATTHGAFEARDDKPMTLASYVADVARTAYVEPVAVGDVLMDMPLFLSEAWYVNVPLEATYMAAYRGVPGYWKDVIEGRGS